MTVSKFKSFVHRTERCLTIGNSNNVSSIIFFDSFNAIVKDITYNNRSILSQNNVLNRVERGIKYVKRGDNILRSVTNRISVTRSAIIARGIVPLYDCPSCFRELNSLGNWRNVFVYMN